MNPEYALLARHAATLAASPGLLLNPPAAARPAWAEAYGVCTQDYAVQRGIGGVFATAPDPEQLVRARRVILFLPKTKARLRWHLAQVAPAGLPLWLVGRKTGGVASAGKVLRQWFDQVDKLDAARHCQLWQAANPRPAGTVAAPEPAETRGFEFELVGLRLRVGSAPGVFAAGRLDPGSRMLLETLSRQAVAGRVLDFGCGSGVLGAWTRLRWPEAVRHLELVDNDAFALEATRATLEINGLHGRVAPVAGAQDLEGPWDWIVTNPPFHQGLDTSHQATLELLRGLPRLLARRGRLVMVANRFLPYPRILEELGLHHRELAGDNRFRVLQVRR